MMLRTLPSPVSCHQLAAGVNVQTDAGLARVEGQSAGLPSHVPHLDHAVSTPREQAVALVESGIGNIDFNQGL